MRKKIKHLMVLKGLLRGAHNNAYLDKTHKRGRRFSGLIKQRTSTQHVWMEP